MQCKRIETFHLHFSIQTLKEKYKLKTHEANLIYIRDQFFTKCFNTWKTKHKPKFSFIDFVT